MGTLQMPVDEPQRIEALKRYSILDTPLDGAFDRITELAASIFNVPIAIISLVDTDRIWFKSHFGLSINQINRDPGLCASAILGEDLFIVENATLDPRSLANPLVAGEFGLRFYAAAPLQTEDHYNLGTLCIIDKIPRRLTDDQKGILRNLSKIVMEEMELKLLLRNTVQKMKKLSTDLSAQVKSTIHNIESTKEDGNSKLIAYLESSHLYLMNFQNQLDQF